MVTESTLEPGSRCRFEISLTDRGPVVEGSGEVTHVRSGEDGPSGVGLRFLTLDEEGAALLDELSDTYHRDGLEAMVSLLEVAADEIDAVLPDTQRMTPVPSREEPSAGDEEKHASGVDELDDTAPIPPLSVSRPEDVEAAEPEIEPEQTTMIDTTEFHQEHGERELSREPEAEASVEPVVEAAAETGSVEETVDPALHDLPAEEAAGPPMDDDPLSKTLDVARDRHDLPRTESTRRRASGVLVWSSILVVFVLGAWLFWRHRDAFEWPGLLATRELSGWEGEEPYVMAEVEDPDEGSDPPSRESRETEGAGIGPGGAQMETISEGPPGSEGPYHSVQEIRWEETGEGLWVSVVLDGAISPEDYRVFRAPESPAREVVQLFGVDEPYPVPELPVASSLVAKIRTGFHEVEGIREQRLVLDLAGSEVELDRVEAGRGMLRLLLVDRDRARGEESGGEEESADAPG